MSMARRRQTSSSLGTRRVPPGPWKRSCFLEKEIFMRVKGNEERNVRQIKCGGYWGNGPQSQFELTSNLAGSGIFSVITGNDKLTYPPHLILHPAAQAGRNKGSQSAN